MGGLMEERGKIFYDYSKKDIYVRWDTVQSSRN
jgi:hypothetical protein